MIGIKEQKEFYVAVKKITTETTIIRIGAESASDAYIKVMDNPEEYTYGDPQVKYEHYDTYKDLPENW
mgnify:CR=1 FL=1